MRAEATPPPDAPSKTFEKPAVLEGTPAPAPMPAATAAPVATVERRRRADRHGRATVARLPRLQWQRHAAPRSAFHANPQPTPEATGAVGDCFHASADPYSHGDASSDCRDYLRRRATEPLETTGDDNAR